MLNIKYLWGQISLLKKVLIKLNLNEIDIWERKKYFLTFNDLSAHILFHIFYNISIYTGFFKK